MRAVYLQNNSTNNSPRQILNKYNEMKTMQHQFLTTSANQHTELMAAQQQLKLQGKPLMVFKKRKKSEEKIKMEA